MTTAKTEREVASEVTVTLTKRTIEVWADLKCLRINIDIDASEELVALVPALLRELSTY